MAVNQQTAVTPKAVAQYVVEQLAAWGCRTIYGVAGDATLYLMDAIAQQGEIQYVNCRLETTAALMASAEAKRTGRLAVCTATSGPGVASLINGLGDAAQDQAPVLAITGQVERKDVGTGAKQEVDQQQLIQPLAVYSALATDARAIPIQLNLAMKKALSRGGVAHLSVPKEVWLEGVDADLFPLMSARTVPSPDSGEMEWACQILNACSRPVILAGRGVKNVQEAIPELAEKLGAAIITTLPARPFVSNSHRLFVGGLGQAGSDIASDLLKDADACLILGSTWWPEDFVPQKIPVVQVDATPENIGNTMSVSAPVVGDLSSVLPFFIRNIRDHQRFAWLQRIQELKARWKAQIEMEARLDTQPIAPQRVISALNRCVAPDAIITLDVGDHVLWFNRIFQTDRQEILVSGRWRTLGFALPAAMSAKRSEPDRQVVALVGDGGFGTTMVDLVTAVVYQWPITIVVMNNGSFAMEQNRMIQAGLHPLGSDVNNPDFSLLAQAFGAEGFRVETGDQLEVTLSQALTSDKVSVVDVVCDDPIVPHTKI